MTMATKARLHELKRRSIDAERLGHAFLECTPATREQICSAVLDDLQVNIEALVASGHPSEVKQRSVDDCLRAMDRQRIKPKAAWRVASDAVIAADKKVLEDQRVYAAKARRALQDRRDFEAWKAQRTEANGAAGMQKITDREDNDVD